MYAFIILLQLLLKPLPLAMVRRIGACLGVLLWWQNGRGAKVTCANLALCFPQLPEAERNAMARRSMREMGINGLELFKVWLSPPEAVLQKIVSIENEACYTRALASGAGCMVLVPHLGNWEVVGLYVATRGPITSMYAPLRQTALDKLVKTSRETTGATLVPTDVSGVKAQLKALKRGEQAGILPDQRAEASAGVFSSFYGVPAYTPFFKCQPAAAYRCGYCDDGCRAGSGRLAAALPGAGCPRVCR